MSAYEDKLKELAHCYGIATEFWGYSGKLTQVSTATLRAVLAAMQIPAQTAEQVDAALVAASETPWRQALPPFLVHRQGSDGFFPVHLPHGSGVTVEIVLENGGKMHPHQLDRWVNPREIDGAQVGEASFALSCDLPPGWHQVNAYFEDGTTATSQLAVYPHHLDPDAVCGGKLWGLAAQLYSVMSRRGWAFGDVGTLRDLLAAAAAKGADFLLINPLHAAGTMLPMAPSPYLPASRRFVSPIYVDIEAVPEYAALDEDARTKIQKLKATSTLSADGLIDRDRVWKAKKAALEILYQVPLRPVRAQLFQRFRAEAGSSLHTYAKWCAFIDANGTYPAINEDDAQRALTTTAPVAAPPPNPHKVAFYEWAQWVVATQLTQAQLDAKQLGMRVGIMHDLAVGIHPCGADRWANPDLFAANICVGAPGDMYNPLGQNWSQPPWNPLELARQQYRPYIEMVRSALKKGGALRIDHIMGLFRLWWIPATAASAAEGTYVRYDHEAMVGILALEAYRAGAVVVGEDLGTVEPWVRDFLADRGILGTSVLWFDVDEAGNPVDPAHKRHRMLASVNTHDMAPTAGYLRDLQIDVQARLGLLGMTKEDALAASRSRRSRMISAMVQAGVLDEADSEDEEQVVCALHRFIAKGPQLLICASLVDAVGEHRMQNQPGTDQEYPNWRVPLGGPDARPVCVEELADNARFQTLADAIEDAI
ncbi:MAG: 4-alpha-glucanotransferase [Actinomycetaceae bacterium]|nr:4-alpha-glucanotransferase [Actinomycetaceae bacterium]